MLKNLNLSKLVILKKVMLVLLGIFIVTSALFGLMCMSYQLSLEYYINYNNDKMIEYLLQYDNLINILSFNGLFSTVFSGILAYRLLDYIMDCIDDKERELELQAELQAQEQEIRKKRLFDALQNELNYAKRRNKHK